MDREPDSRIIDLPDDTWHSAFDSPEDPPARASRSKQPNKPKTIKPAKKCKDNKRKKKKKLQKDRKSVKKDSNHRDDANQPGSSFLSDQSALHDDLYDPLLVPPTSSSSFLRSAPCPKHRSTACAKLLVRA